MERIMNINDYNKVKKKSTDLEQVKINTYVPTPKLDDYKSGYITRFFVQKTNDKNSPIYELSYKSISKFENKPYYIVVSLDWRIKGPVDEVKKSNSASIRIASQIIPKLSLYLPNLLQFHKK